MNRETDFFGKYDTVNKHMDLLKSREKRPVQGAQYLP